MELKERALSFFYSLSSVDSQKKRSTVDTEGTELKIKDKMRRSDIITVLKDYKKMNATRFGFSQIGLFGSIARDEYGSDSDIDIIVHMAPDIFKLVHIKEELENGLNRKVDIVRYREKMNPYLKKRIEKDVIYV